MTWLVQCSMKIKGMNQGYSFTIIADNFVIVLHSNKVFEHSYCHIRVISIRSIYLI